MIFTTLGETEEIGASCHYLMADGSGILLDAGADPEKEGTASMPDLDRIADHPDWPVDHAVVTHGHHDHLGSLPMVVQRFPHVQVHMTSATRQLANILLPASARLQRRKVKEGSTTVDPLFDEDDVEASSYVYMAHPLENEFDLSGYNAGFEISGEFYDAGHVLGSVGVMVRFVDKGEQRNLFFTGDTGVQSQTIIPGASYPDEQVDILVLESTLGADPVAETVTRRSEEKRLGEALSTVLNRGGTVLMPVFALGRGQEMLALIDRYKKRGLIHQDVPVYTAGMMRAIADVYDKTRMSTPRLNEEFQVYGVPQQRLPRSESGLNEALKQPGIMCVGSGMMFEQTISNKIARQIVSNEKNGVFFVGYAREDSPGDLLIKARLEGKGTDVVLHPARGPQPVMCDVDKFRFSGHSHRRDLLKLVDKLRPSKIVLVHGEAKAKAWMAENIRFHHPDIEVHTPTPGQVLEL
ncbi:MAG: MBL fold metallo-hydrolase [Bacteroidetes bacterium]|nr:MBL fold metallo-hydrolase [Bacteroidota bacterium]